MTKASPDKVFIPANVMDGMWDNEGEKGITDIDDDEDDEYGGWCNEHQRWYHPENDCA